MIIRVNLLKNSGGGGGGTIQVGALTAKNTSSVDVSQMSVIFKVIILLSLPLGLIGYESYNKGNLKEETTKLQFESTQKKREIENYGPKVQEVTKMQEEKKRLQAQVDTIRMLSKERLQSVKALDAMQNIIPLRTWLTRLQFDNRKVEITGISQDDLEIAKYMQSLEDSIYFQSVKLISSREVKTERGVYKQFNIHCLLENM